VLSPSHEHSGIKTSPSSFFGLEREWLNHLSRFSGRWLTAMQSAKLVFQTGDVRNPDFRVRITAAVQPGVRAMVLKDAHLIEAANAADHVVVSLDDKVRRPLRDAASELIELQRLVWVNPNNTNEQALDWLRRGAKTEARRLLVNWPGKTV
jgi:hypothetical protein